MSKLTVEEIKATRLKYGLSQRSFAALLGIGSASITRYENGAPPSKANANLIRAAKDPRFMQGCLERDGALITAEQRRKAQECVYAYITLEPEGEATDEMTRIYKFTLQQEVLAERTANIISEIIRWQVADEIAGGRGDQFSELCSQLAMMKPEILNCENGDWLYLERIAGYLDCAEKMIALADLRDAA